MKIYNYVNEQIKLLGETTIINNPNYLKVIKAIPTYFDTNNLMMCMTLAFNFGEMKGRECERDLIKWNASATFYNMKSYASEHNGELPDTFKDLKNWRKEIVSQVIHTKRDDVLL